MEIHAKPRRTKKETQKGGEESVDFVAWEDEFQLVVFGVGKMQTPYLIGFLYIYTYIYPQHRMGGLGVFLAPVWRQFFFLQKDQDVSRFPVFQKKRSTSGDRFWW